MKEFIECMFHNLNDNLARGINRLAIQLEKQLQDLNTQQAEIMKKLDSIAEDRKEK